MESGHLNAGGEVKMESRSELVERLLTSALFECLPKDGSFRWTCVKCGMEGSAGTGKTGQLKLRFCDCGELTGSEKYTVIGKISRSQKFEELVENLRLMKRA
jgi:hypothetical protein